MRNGFKLSISNKIFVALQTLKWPLLFLTPQLAWAHAHPIAEQGFMQGLWHPITGLDHCLAMFAVGLLASKAQKPFTWVLPLIFLGFMLVGGLIGFQKIALPWIELGIVTSVFVLGLFITYSKQIPYLILMGSLAIFALCHGHAHGYEMVPGTLASLYASGFLLATATLHVMGYWFGRLVLTQTRWLFALMGATLTVSSLWL